MRGVCILTDVAEGPQQRKQSAASTAKARSAAAAENQGLSPAHRSPRSIILSYTHWPTHTIHTSIPRPRPSSLAYYMGYGYKPQ
ncbi:hypothetical protein RR48_08237 [Papilio machaon]|uniref:Uncharacterized protein n=1 Tax=Papilio machaon TaxID=76193 RepID=A0A194RF68_PAPMA|nr:hypothetical protein RR48_08237 [Papilio machaon]